MNHSPYIITFDYFEQAKKISEEYLRSEHLLFENMILIDNLDLDSLALAADLESYSYEVQDNCCFVAIPMSRSKQLSTKFLRLLKKLVPLPNKISNYFYLRFCCQYISSNSNGTQIYLVSYGKFCKYIYCFDDAILFPITKVTIFVMMIINFP